MPTPTWLYKAKTKPETTLTCPPTAELGTTSAKEWGLANRSMKDPVWLYILARWSEPCTLISYDNKMPVVHRDSLLKQASTVAIIDSKGDRGGLGVEEYKREVMHRWAHRMAVQSPGTVVKYWRTGSRTLTI
jgi:hypothetical protein